MLSGLSIPTEITVWENTNISWNVSYEELESFEIHVIFGMKREQQNIYFQKSICADSSSGHYCCTLFFG